MPYQKDRITSFLNPEDDKTGAGWHALQSLTAIGNGQFLGEGFMRGTQNQFQFLPDQYSDFPFSVFCEDWGFVGAVGYSASTLRVLLGDSRRLARQGSFRRSARRRRRSELFWHVVMNVGMAVGLLPVVGITLPLFSYGGSNVVTMLIGLGLLMNVSMRE